MSRPRGTRNMMWFTCEDCGQRWERVHAVNDTNRTAEMSSMSSRSQVGSDQAGADQTNHSFLQNMQQFPIYYTQQIALGRDKEKVRAEMEMELTDEKQRIALSSAIGYFHQAEMP